MAESEIYIKQFEVGIMANFVYFVGDKKTREVYVVDPAWEVDTILRKAKEEDLKIKGALITHYHYDHTNGITDITKELDIPIYVNKADIPFLDEKPSNIKAVDSAFKVQAGDVEIEMIHTPGHTPGSQCFKISDNLVSGDTLFIGGCGRTDLPGGNAEELYFSLTKRLAKMSDSTILFPGHNYAEATTSTLGNEKKTNPYLLCDSLEKFLRFRTGVYDQ